MNLAEAYEVLHLQPGAPESVARAAFRAMSKSVHPDVGGRAVDFQRIGEAFDTIKAAGFPSAQAMTADDARQEATVPRQSPAGSPDAAAGYSGRQVSETWVEEVFGLLDDPKNCAWAVFVGGGGLYWLVRFVKTSTTYDEWVDSAPVVGLAALLGLVICVSVLVLGAVRLIGWALRRLRSDSYY